MNNEKEKQKKENGYSVALKEKDYFFKKWGEYMRRTQLAERKVEKLKALVLLVDPSVSSVEVGEVSLKQWQEYLKEFPDEQ